MPYGDRSGPMGAGPRTGRGAGFCGGYDAPGYINPGFGQGFGMGFGRGRGFGGGGGGRGFGGGGGRGWRHMYWATGQPGWMRSGQFGAWSEPEFTAEGEKGFLQREAGFLEKQLGEIRRRLDDLSKPASNEGVKEPSE